MINISKLYCQLSGESDKLRYERKHNNKPIVVFNCTYKCNLKCLHCYSSSTDKIAPDEMNTHQAKKMIDQIVRYNSPVLLFSGGEPLMREDLFTLIAYAKDRNLRTVLSTNGTLINESTAKRLKELGLAYVGISIDGSERQHDTFRNVKGAFARTLDGIKNCKKVGIRTGLRFTVTKDNFNDIQQVFAIANENNIRRICFYHLIHTGRAKKLDSISLTLNETRNWIDSVIDLTKSQVQLGLIDEVFTVGNHADGAYLLSRMESENHPNLEFAKKLLLANGGNRIGQNICSVNWDGNVYADQFWRHASLGNIRQVDFEEIWDDENNSILKKLRHKNQYKTIECVDCRYFDLCKGNYRSLNNMLENDTWTNEPKCYLTIKEKSRL